MRKALNTGLATGIILSLIIIGAGYIQKMLPVASAGNQFVFLALFVGIIALTFWMAMSYYSKSSTVRWGSLNLTGIIASVIATLIVGTAGFLYTRYIDPSYLDTLMDNSQQNWNRLNYEASAIATQGEWEWFKNPWNFAVYHSQVTIVVLSVVALIITSVYYIRHRKRTPDHESSNNHELIF
jgi:hypothetical protein